MFSLYALFFFYTLSIFLRENKNKINGRIFEYLFIYRILTVTCHNIFAEMSNILGIFEFHI